MCSATSRGILHLLSHSEVLSIIIVELQKREIDEDLLFSPWRTGADAPRQKMEIVM